MVIGFFSRAKISAFSRYRAQACAGSTPLVCAVSTRVTPASLKRSARACPQRSISPTSTRWLMKELTLRMPLPRFLPSRKIWSQIRWEAREKRSWDARVGVRQFGQCQPIPSASLRARPTYLGLLVKVHLGSGARLADDLLDLLTPLLGVAHELDLVYVSVCGGRVGRGGTHRQTAVSRHHSDG